MFRVRDSVVLDTSEMLIGHDEVSQVIVCSNRRGLLDSADRIGAVTVSTRAEGFDFGRVMLRIVREFRIDSLLCMGGSAAPLLSERDIEWMAHELAEENTVIVNNPLSTDLIAVRPASILTSIELPAFDNFLGYLIWEAGFRRIVSDGRPWLWFDLDTPTDYLILETRKELRKRTEKALSELNWPREPIRAALKALGKRRPELFLGGRVGTRIIDFLNHHLMSRVRTISEERGMKALGRDSAGKVRSLMAEFIEAVGFKTFFRLISECCDAAFIDSRVLFSHWSSGETDANDRYNSDLFRLEKIRDPRIREFTGEALRARIPVLLGGHGLVGGSLWALASALPRAEFLVPRSRGG